MIGDGYRNIPLEYGLARYAECRGFPRSSVADAFVFFSFIMIEEIFVRICSMWVYYPVVVKYVCMYIRMYVFFCFFI